MSDLDDLGRAAGNLPPLPPSHPTGARFSVPASPAVPAQPPPTPRPLGTERVWFVRDGWGQQRGPLSEKELTNHLVAGRVGTDCVVWQHGWPAWQPILSYFQLPPPAPVYRVPVYARPPQRGMSGGTWALLIVGGLVVGCCLLGQVGRLFRGEPLGSPAPAARSSIVPEGRRGVTREQIIAEFGEPDEEDDTLHDHPRPPIVTKWLVYRPQRVKFMFVSSGSAANPTPPWKLVGALDLETKNPLTADQTVKRFGKSLP
jgi:hypothetical protein